MDWLQVAIFAKGIIEVALLTLIGQALLYVLAGAKREQNVFYRILKTITSPAFKFTRLITPRIVLDSQIGMVVFFLLSALWLIATYYKICLLAQVC